MEIPSQIGKYKILSSLGRGASGCVLKAEQKIIQRVVALKVLFNDVVQAKPTIIKRFKREARLAASLVHPNIVPIFEIEENNGLHYYTMQYVEGLPMTKYLAERSPSFHDKLEIFIQLCDALALAHRNDIIHRDLKPHNVIISEDKTPMILDFGIAKSLMDDEQMTQAGHILGSAFYMAPEQARSEQVGTYTDVFGLGVMMYEAFTGVRPFKGNSVRELIFARLEYGKNPERHRPADITVINEELPAALNRIVLKCLQAPPEKRYQTAEGVLKDLRRLQKEMRISKSLHLLEKEKKKLTRPINKKTSYFYPFFLSFILLVLGIAFIGYWRLGLGLAALKGIF